MSYKNKQPFCIDEISCNNGKKLKCISYWDSDTSFKLDISSTDDDYFIHSEYNYEKGIWHYIFEIWFKDCNINDSSKKYLTDIEITELQKMTLNLCKANVKEKR